MLTGRHPDKSAETLIHAGGPATDGRSSYDEIASARRKRDRQAPAQRVQPAGINRRRAQCDPESECQSVEEGIANGSGEVPSLLNPKTFSA
jgi:hypothetical protein